MTCRTVRSTEPDELRPPLKFTRYGTTPLVERRICGRFLVRRPSRFREIAICDQEAASAGACVRVRRAPGLADSLGPEYTLLGGDGQCACDREGAGAARRLAFSCRSNDCGRSRGKANRPGDAQRSRGCGPGLLHGCCARRPTGRLRPCLARRRSCATAHARKERGARGADAQPKPPAVTTLRRGGRVWLPISSCPPTNAKPSTVPAQIDYLDTETRCLNASVAEHSPRLCGVQATDDVPGERDTRRRSSPPSATSAAFPPIRATGRYLGLDPRSGPSGAARRTTPDLHTGRRARPSDLTESALVAVNTPFPMRAFYDRSAPAGHPISIVAVARKLAVLFCTNPHAAADYAFPARSDPKAPRPRLLSGAQRSPDFATPTVTSYSQRTERPAARARHKPSRHRRPRHRRKPPAQPPVAMT